MATREKARLAKLELTRRLEGEKWLRGVGLGGDGSAYAVRVDVARLTPEISRKIPKKLDDVDVIVEAVGDISPHDD